MEKRWPVGQVIGSEALLMRRFNVGRCVIREAQQILDSRGVAKPKRGPGGGLVVTAPRDEVMYNLARMLLDYRGFGTGDLVEAWVAMEVVLVERLADTITVKGVGELRRSLDSAINADDFREYSGSTHAVIARLAGNKVAELLIGTLSDVLRAYCSQLDPDELRRMYNRHVALINAIEAGQAAEAVSLVRHIFDEVRPFSV